MGELRIDPDSRALLDPARGRLEPALRASLPEGGFAAAGAALAKAHGSGSTVGGAPSFFPRLRNNIMVLQQAHRCIALQGRRGLHVSAAGEWLLDNIQVLAAQTREVHDGLPRRYYRGLPVLLGPPPGGLPRVYAIAWAFVGLADSAFDAPSLIELLDGYQRTEVLNLGELWALPTTLRVVLIENLRRLAEQVATDEAAGEAADLLFDTHTRGLAIDPAPAFARMRRRGVEVAFALQLMHRLHADSETGTVQGALGRESLRVAVAAALPDPTAAMAQAQADLAADHHSVAQAIGALQALGNADWRGLVARCSPLMQCLLQSPVFAAERDDTQDLTLHAVERLARRCRRSEVEVATSLLGHLQEPPAADALGDGAPAHAPTYWLRGLGATALRATLGLAAWPTLLRAALQRLTLPLYVGAWISGSVLLTLAFIAGAAVPAAPTWALWLTAALVWWPASEVASAVLQRLVSEWAPPRRLPRLALPAGIPPEERVLVVVPAILHGPDSVGPLLQRLERHHLANRENHVQFALLSDFADADQADAAGDDELLAAAVAAVNALDARHRVTAGKAEPPRRFLLLHRRRRWSQTEQRWIGWERKRGKLEQLLSWLAEPGSDSPFIALGAASAAAPGTAHVLTLDSDTALAPGALRDLVGVAAHPMNRPRIDVQRRRVAAGHAILQPRVDVAWPAAADGTPFYRLFAGVGGHDPYNAASSDVYSDLFDEASFGGKGLLNVAAVHAVLGGRLPAGQVLSHDLIEGAIARCGGVGDVQLAEPAPTHPDVAAARGQRWTRGDWQLLPLLLHPRRYGLRLIDVWKMLDNLRRPLVAPLGLVLLAVALAAGPVSAWAVLVLAAAAFGSGPLLGAVAGLAPSRGDLALRHFGRESGADLLRAVAVLLWQLALWPRQAATNLGAIGQALWRSFVSRRGLLQWSTAAALPAALRPWRAAWHAHGALAIAALLAWPLLWWAGTPEPLLAAALCLLWAGTPGWIAWAGRAPAAPGPALDAADRGYLLGVAHDTWRFFEQQVGAATNHLPPDNVQTVPHLIVAQRTSPTNIGLYLLSLACARAFGWLGREQLLARCEATLDTLERLPRHRGHLMNWIDTQTLQTLLPAYVSTVDSGNLCAHLLGLAGACDAEAAQAGWPEALPAILAEPCDVDGCRLRAVAARCRALAEATEFGFLYDARRRLLHIGWRPEPAAAEGSTAGPGVADAGLYDLLASESRLASLWAIAKGDVPAAHWAALGRPFQAAGRDVGLRSWSGSMFEYLMPALVVDEPAGSALGRASRMALHEQRRFAAEHELPWGVSECAMATVDRSLAYQYGPQGVPRLALRRTPPDEQVVAPYATALAALLDPAAAAANLRVLEALQPRGPWGFIEALDFSPPRQPDDAAAAPRFVPVHTAMAHHQGMTLVALTNVLLQGLPRRWTLADARLQAVASLLHERVPREVAPVPQPPVDERRHGTPAATAPRAGEWLPGTSALPPTHLLSNGRYSVALRPSGAGWSRFGATDITRWRDDALRDALGSFVFVRRQGSPAAFSITQHPAPDNAAHYEAQFHADRVCFVATWPDLRVRCTVSVDADDDLELRRLEFWNTSSEPLALEVLSMFEVCLSPALADEMHPAFANLFVSADWSSTQQALSFARKPRREDEPGLHAAHFVVQADAGVSAARALADRARWGGRLRGRWQPLAAFDAADADNGPRATGLDPVAALSMRLSLPPHGAAQLTLGTAAAAGREALAAGVSRWRDAGRSGTLTRASPGAAALALLQADAWRPTADTRAAIQVLTSVLVMLVSRPAPARGGARFNRSALWRFGISGERPLISVQIGHVQGLRLVRALVHGLLWWARGGVACDLVLINTEPASYLMPLQRELQALRDGHIERRASATGPFGEIFLWSAAEVSAAERTALVMLARVRLVADGRPLAQHVEALAAWHEVAQAERDEQHGVLLVASPGDRSGVEAAEDPAPRGAFEADGRRFVFSTRPARPTPRPWVNVLANPDFGALVSEAGSGCTWAGNSRLHQLTAWGNDPLLDMQGEAFHVQDSRTRETWRVGGGETSALGSSIVEHAPGITRVRQQQRALSCVTSWCVDAALPVKRVRIELHNQGERLLRLRVAALLEWMLGATRVERQSVLTTWSSLDADGARVNVLLATQLDDLGGRGGHTAFLAVHRPGAAGAAFEDWTCDRRELFDARGRRVLPDHLGRRSGIGLDPCAAVSLTFELDAGATQGCVFVIGHATSPEAAQALAQACVRADALAAEQAARAQWETLLGAVTVKSPDPLFDALVNHWLLYQVVSCRLWGRAGFYQAGGAFGFRDQLQDAMALALTAPRLLREHLLRAAARQFVEGDVQHWWHPDTGAGVRTRFSDDLLWLPHATAYHVQVTGDTAVLDERVPFIEGEALADAAEDAYFVPRVSTQTATLYEHCARAIDRSLAVGAHGLPLIGAGDWNDGMNRVGPLGRGESVWLGWFLCRVVADFMPLAETRGDTMRVRRWAQAARGWRQALQGPAWDGEWFVRAFFDDGSALGSKHNAECRIDLIAQAWSVLCGAAEPARQRQAMASAMRLLADESQGLWRLLTPPLVAAKPSAGYIQAYPPGVRENGGQYAHAGAWAVMALAELGEADLAWRTWTWLSPAHRSAHPVHGVAYGLEPYVMAADVYTEPPYVGRGGWSWYTGSAAVMHRAALESICGLQVCGLQLRVRPCLPSHWPAVMLTLRLPGGELRLTVCAPGATDEIAKARAEGATELAAGDWSALPRGGARQHRLVLAAAAGLSWPAARAAGGRTPA